MSKQSLGISGKIAAYFFRSEITPLLALVGLLMGIFAAVMTPKEEDPQIDVTFANVFIPFPGSSAKEVESLITVPTEQLLSEIKGVEHVYSTSRPGIAIFSVQFIVGEPRTDALLRLYNKLYSHLDYMAPNVGVGQPIIKPKGIDEVPIVSLTLTSDKPDKSAFEISKVAHAIELELKRIHGTNEIYTIGAPDQVVHVVLDPQKMSANSIAINDLRMALQSANHSTNAGNIVRNNQEIQIQAGVFLTKPEEISSLVVGMSNGAPVFLRDVADIELKSDDANSYVWMEPGLQAVSKGIQHKHERAAVTIAIAKQAGINAQSIAKAVNERIEQLRGTYIPDDINITVTRDYGKTANDKANKLIEKLFLVTLVVVALVFFALGKKEAFVVGVAVIITLAVTLFASWAFGFTLNRVSLFALIFSIGILVDDAIVVVENIHRHMQRGDRSLKECIPVAVDEVGGPTILATFTVMAALLPMAFVSGLMGPYMSPIPINASAGMFISLIIAFSLTPWMMYKVLKNSTGKSNNESVKNEKDTSVDPGHEMSGEDTRFHNVFFTILSPFLDADKGRQRRWYLLAVILMLITGAIMLVVTKSAVLKMLPFDDKSEFQVVLDMPEGSSLERTAEVLHAMSNYLKNIPEVTDIEAYAGTSSPINFNGLVRQYYLRSQSNMGDLQVNLLDKSHRKRKSHEIALSVREELTSIAERYQAAVKVVEVPPGPPVMAPVVAEVYGQDYPLQIQLAKSIRKEFEETDGIVDIDDSTESATDRLIIKIDRQKAAKLGVSQSVISQAINTAIKGEDASYLHSGHSKYSVPIRLEVEQYQKSNIEQLLLLKVRNSEGILVAIKDLVNIENSDHEYSIYHKDLLPVVYVTSDGAGETDSPLYGMFSLFGSLSEKYPEMEQAFTAQPDNPYVGSIKWDGEWQVTYETFRDMGIAYAIGLIIIYLLVVIQFRSYIVPLVIMAPIPLTIIGIMPGHALWGAQFTATSMIGMIALAGIIVRNSILLVDFINLEIAAGKPFREAIIRSAVVRAKPIALTAMAAILDALFILDDPIFLGLALSLIFGILISTLLTLVVVPVVYYAAREKELVISA